MSDTFREFWELVFRAGILNGRVRTADGTAWLVMMRDEVVYAATEADR